MASLKIFRFLFYYNNNNNCCFWNLTFFNVDGIFLFHMPQPAERLGNKSMGRTRRVAVFCLYLTWHGKKKKSTWKERG